MNKTVQSSISMDDWTAWMSPAASTCIIICYATRHGGHGFIAAAEACQVQGCNALVYS
jgi:hypothetical protein